MIDTAFLITSFVTLLVIIDPFGLAPMFVALTKGMTPRARRIIAFRACAVATGILMLFAWLGETLLDTIGISMPAFRVAGGALLFLTALEMLFERRSKRREDKVEEDMPDPSVFPLAIPLISGPGAITSIILLSEQQSGAEGLAQVIQVIGVMIAVMAVVLAMFLMSGFLERLLGKTGIEVVTRLLGMLLAALAVEFILDGLRDFNFAS
ncbi:MAG: MarC family protein [Rhodobacteraceae bacterium]|nr:MarC family protein [Paracoccaceae bacterium]